MLSCGICKISKNNYFEEYPWTIASKLYLKGDSDTGIPCTDFVNYSRALCQIKPMNDWLQNTGAGVSI